MKIISVCGILLLLLFVLGGCFFLPAETPAPYLSTVILPEIRPPRTVLLSRGDVLRTTITSVQHVPAREERLYFNRDGITVQGIYVSVGDLVTEGSIIAELNQSHIEVQLHAALREEEWLLLEISQLDARHRHSLWEAGQTGIPVDDSSYFMQLGALRFQLDALRMRIEYLQSQNEQRYLRAPMDGTVTTVAHFHEGMQSAALRTVAAVADQSQMVFRSTLPDDALMQPGDYFEIEINQIFYPAQVIDPEDYGISRSGMSDRDVFMVITGDYHPIITAAARAFITIILEEARDVYFLPRSALHQTETRTFVFVLEDGVRVLREVEIGVIGNTTVEIISGLAREDLVLNE